MAEAVNQPTKLPLNKLANLVKNRDLLLSVAVVFVLGMLIVPMPVALLDFLMLINLMAGLLIILTALYAKNALDFSVFPTILLFSTVFRMAVNVSSTRLILTQGTGFEGQVVRTFADFVVGGNYVVGFIVFVILTAAQFLVITKGASRVSEVSARFKLDSLPGKQMAIDADLNAGLISEKEAISRRQNIQEEADFYGNMDGATKFVSGDVKLGILVTLINIVGGIVVGVVIHSEALNEAFRTYVMLAVGDGLVAQIPSLLVATATGVVVTRSLSFDSLSVDMSRQLLANPKTLYITSAFAFVMGAVPGFPIWVFWPTAIAIGFVAYRLGRVRKEQQIKESIKSESEGLREEDEYTPENMINLVHVDPLEIELGYGLIPLVDKSSGGDLLERVKKSRRQIVLELGIIMPQLRITDNMQLEPDEYVIKINGGEIGKASIEMDGLLAMATSSEGAKLEGKEAIREPVFGLPAYWIPSEEKEETERKGFNVVDGPTIVATHLTEVIRRNAADILGRKETKELIENLKKKNLSLVEEMETLQVKVSDLQKVLKGLLREQVSIRNLNTIVEVVCDHSSSLAEIDTVIEFVRAGLGRQITSAVSGNGKVVNAIVFSPELEEQLVSRVSVVEGGGGILNLSPEILKQFVERISHVLNETRRQGFDDVLVASAYLRRPLANVLLGPFPNLNILSVNEIAKEYEIHPTQTL